MAYPTTTGPCRVCGGTLRYPSGACKPCNDARAKAYDPEKRKQYRRRYVVSHREQRETWRRNHRQKPKLGFLERQGGACAVCGRDDRLVLDHSHVSDVKRGVLCSDCNVGLGLFHDDPEMLRQAALYLETHDGSS